MSQFANWTEVSAGPLVVKFSFEERIDAKEPVRPIESVVMVRADAEALRDLLNKLLPAKAQTR